MDNGKGDYLNPPFWVDWPCSPNGKCPCEREEKDCPLKNVCDKDHYIGSWTIKD